MLLPCLVLAAGVPALPATPAASVAAPIATPVEVQAIQEGQEVPAEPPVQRSAIGISVARARDTCCRADAAEIPMIRATSS